MIFCFVLKGESEVDCMMWICQYEDFFNVIGMGMVDDFEEFCVCQVGYVGIMVMWNDLLCGVLLWVDGLDENVKKMGLNLCILGECSEDEGLFVCQYEYWVYVMCDVLKKECGEVVV